MKKFIFAVVVLSLLISTAAWAAETQKQEAMSGMAMGHPKGMSMPGMEKMSCKTAQMVATDKGGVIVLAGNKLMKYDADLNLVKEAEVAMPMGGKQCPMMGKMSDQDPAAAAAGSQEKTV